MSGKHKIVAPAIFLKRPGYVSTRRDLLAMNLWPQLQDTAAVPFTLTQGLCTGDLAVRAQPATQGHKKTFLYCLACHTIATPLQSKNFSVTFLKAKKETPSTQQPLVCVCAVYKGMYL